MYYASKLMAKHGVKAVFSDREGGCSFPPFDSLNLGYDLGDSEADVTQNLNALCSASALPIPHQTKQVHGVQLLKCQGDGIMNPVEADILLASTPNTALAVRTADCLPILMSDPQAGVISAVHAGWKGTVAQVVQVATRTMCELGAKPETIIASLGPGIASCCFEVNKDIAAQLKASCAKDVSSTLQGKVFADLTKTNFYQLLNQGVLEEHIEVSAVCTACNHSPEYFSYRRDKGKTGRQLSVIMMS